jgi:hypothetical protein
MVLHRRAADVEPYRNGRVLQARHQQTEYLALAGRQVVARRGRRVQGTQDIPARVSTDPAHITGDTASVTVRLHFGGSERHIIARVIRDPAADIWSIDDLACGH